MGIGWGTRWTSRLGARTVPEYKGFFSHSAAGARRGVEFAVQVLLDFLVEDRCVVCGRGASVASSLGSLHPYCAALGQPVRWRVLDMIRLENRPLCRGCLEALQPARHPGLLGRVSGQSLITPSGACFPTHPPASACLSTNPQRRLSSPSVAVHAPFMTDDKILKLIHLLKFDRYDALAVPMAEAIFRAMPGPCEKSGRGPVFVPIPMEPEELRRRRIHAPLLIAHELARRTQGTVAASALVKVARTARQSQTEHAKRAENVRDAFRCAGTGLVGRHVALVDDLVTSGSTAAACAAVLLGSGVAKVEVVCFARAI